MNEERMNEETRVYTTPETPQEEPSKKGPIVETSVGMSKNGRWVIHKTTITDIKSINYYTEVFKGKKE